MTSRKIFLLIMMAVITLTSAESQDDPYHFNIGLTAAYTSAGVIPFWLRSNQYGSIPLDGPSLSVISAARKDYTGDNKLFDWGASFEGRLNTGNRNEFRLIEAYAKIRMSIFEIRGGRSKMTMGLCDSTLSSGSFSVAGNALGIPEVRISVPEFFIIPKLGDLFAFKGSYSHGFTGEPSVRLLNNDTAQLKTFLHQKSFYGRFGKPAWKWKLYGGFNHQAFWGSEETYYVGFNTLTPFQTYLYVITGKPYGTENFSASKIGNHMGSIDIGFEYNFKNISILLYRQNIYDIGALYYLANIRDGLNGLSLVNKQSAGKDIRWRKMLLEFFYTKNQAGELWSPFVPSGDENYYNNDQYINGWSYKNIGIGNPFICTRVYTREGLPADPRDYFLNNRVILFHYGIEGSIKELDIRLKASYSLNYGTFGTSEVGHTLGKDRTLPVYGIFEKTQQFSFLFSGTRQLNGGFTIGGVAAFDAGDLYYNSAGILISVTKIF